MKKVMIISAVQPMPVNNGKRVVIKGLLDYFQDRNYNIKYIYIGKDNSTIFSKKIEYTCLPMPSTIEKMKNIFMYSIIRRNKSFQEAIMWRKKNILLIQELVSQYNPEIILLDTVRIGQYFLGKEKEKICIYFDDMFSVRYEKMLETKEKYPNISLNPLGNFVANVPRMIIKILRNNIIESVVLKAERELIRKSELMQARFFKKGCLINYQEVNLLSELSCKSTIFEMRPYLGRGNDIKAHKYEGNNEFIFIGALNISHNQVSIINFIRKNAQLLRKIYPECKVRIIGKNANGELKELVEMNSDIFSLEGYVADLDGLMVHACAMIIPLLFGTGVKLKTIESMYYGLPIITTTYGIEGVHITDSAVIREDDIEKFPVHMKKLGDISKNNKYSTEISKSYQDNYTKNIVYDNYDKLFS